MPFRSCSFLIGGPGRTPNRLALPDGSVLRTAEIHEAYRSNRTCVPEHHVVVLDITMNHLCEELFNEFQIWQM